MLYDADWSEVGIAFIIEALALKKGITEDFFDYSFENETFMLAPYRWDHEDENSPDRINFLYKKDNIQVSWYKFFGRSMESNLEDKPGNWVEIVIECINSINL